MDWFNIYSFNWLAVTSSNDFVTLLQFPFMQRAIAGAVLMGYSAAYSALSLLYASYLFSAMRLVMQR
jgi:hypothetical protein